MTNCVFTIPYFTFERLKNSNNDDTSLIEDAEDIYDLWKNGAKNMVTFPEEPRPLAVKRTISHRRWLNGEKTDFTKF